MRYSLYTDFTWVEKTTSMYRVPFDKKTNEKRQENLDEALAVVREKHKKYIQHISVYDIAVMFENGKK